MAIQVARKLAVVTQPPEARPGHHQVAQALALQVLERGKRRGIGGGRAHVEPVLLQEGHAAPLLRGAGLVQAPGAVVDQDEALARRQHACKLGERGVQLNAP